MIRSLFVGIGAIALFVAACDAATAPREPGTVVMPEALTADNVALFSSGPCADTIPAQFVAAYAHDSTAVAGNCGPDTCGGMLDPSEVGVVDIQPDYFVGWHDMAVFQCPNNVQDTVYSSHSCWDCWDLCSAQCVNDGLSCAVVPGQQGSDCRGYSCPAGYEPLRRPFPHPPVCVRTEPCPPPPTASILGQTEIYPGTQCTWEAHVEGGQPPYQYSWSYGSTWVGSGPTWTGGVDSGSTSPHFTLYLMVTDANMKSDGAHLFIQEDPEALLCPL